MTRQQRNSGPNGPKSDLARLPQKVRGDEMPMVTMLAQCRKVAMEQGRESRRRGAGEVRTEDRDAHLDGGTDGWGMTGGRSR
eukprot:746356-Hanusia_phi.AAC.5